MRYLVLLWEKLEKLLEHLHVEFCAVPVLNHGHKVLICAAKREQMPEVLEQRVQTRPHISVTEAGISPFKLLQENIQIQVLLGINERDLGPEGRRGGYFLCVSSARDAARSSAADC